MELIPPHHCPRGRLTCFKYSQSNSNRPHGSVCFCNFVNISYVLFGWKHASWFVWTTGTGSVRFGPSLVVYFCLLIWSGSVSYWLWDSCRNWSVLKPMSLSCSCESISCSGRLFSFHLQAEFSFLRRCPFIFPLSDHDFIMSVSLVHFWHHSRRKSWNWLENVMLL